MPVKSHGRRKKSEGTGYVYGTTVRKPVYEEPPKKPKKRKATKTSKKMNKKKSSSLGQMIWLIFALFISGNILLGYLEVQADYMIQLRKMESLKNTLNIITTANKDEENRINASISLDDIKRVAIEEFGMRPASEKQILYYETTGSDYVRQLADIPQN